MQGTSRNTDHAATWLDDDQYKMLFGEQRGATDLVAPTVVPPKRTGVIATRWDRRRATTETTPLSPPPVPTTVDLTGHTPHIELDIFADDRETRVGVNPNALRLQAPPIPAECKAPTPPAQAEEPENSVRARAVSLGFAFGALAATIALWLIGLSLYY